MEQTDLFFSRMTLSQSGFHVAFSAPRRRRGDPRNSLDFFDFGSAPRARRGEGNGEGETRGRRVSGRLYLGRAEGHRPCEAGTKTPRRSKKKRFYSVIYVRGGHKVGNVDTIIVTHVSMDDPTVGIPRRGIFSSPRCIRYLVEPICL